MTPSASPLPPPPFSDPRLTEQRNPRTERIDVASSLDIVDLLNAEDRTVPAAVHGERERIARAIDEVVAAFGRGGRLVYVGARPSSRVRGPGAAPWPPAVRTAPAAVRRRV